MAVVTSRYARAFADVVTELKLDPQQVLVQVHGFVDLLNENPSLRRVWENPSIPAEQKRGLLDGLVTRMGASKTVRNFIAVLIDHHRAHQLSEIVRLFETELNDRLGLAEVEISSARVLSDGERRELEMQVATMTGKRVHAKYAIDATLLGGAVVRMGSTIYDGSVRGQLQKIRESLSS